MNDSIPTVKIQNNDAKGNYSIINKCDFDKDKHNLFSDKAKKEPKAKAKKILNNSA